MTTKACGVEISCEASAHQILGIAPNMCITPCAPSPLPMPYPNKGDTGKLAVATSKTKINKKVVLTTNGAAKSIMGNEAGTQKDILTMKTGGKAYPVMGAPVVFFEGAMVCITGSPGFSNSM